MALTPGMIRHAELAKLRLHGKMFMARARLDHSKFRDEHSRSWRGLVLMSVRRNDRSVQIARACFRTSFAIGLKDSGAAWPTRL